ncbi:TPA: M15 family metallopeptidase [Stenotrophomonas maltophilia]|uniref:M15 family metallopeptidase n=1 Tax=Stenotrophomonas maltophilia TaxID=40324 RepID=UPI000B4D1DB0|nr:M15 family metallopeptidase [Stenotrophomonas maltophilia]MBH1416750.1 M15 family metallopeptidase [Stenotrophomonas maltophilia]OWQ71360.1 peptidase [Stenotrophomonas maltophilia]HDX0898255.1 M15 family metallopeptidase [Stenotrophomonas maltophilia]HDX0916937.1 M15 family metallopeptidase [Stenotrophomonas maltophilia]HEL3800191.1 M15 family metallopeptidase [Stenotrophomonas maltophilia]
MFLFNKYSRIEKGEFMHQWILRFVFLSLMSLIVSPCFAHVEKPITSYPLQSSVSVSPVKNANETQWWNFFKKKRNEKLWKGVHPDMRTKLEAVYDVMAQRGFDMRPMEGMRSEARQAALLASNSGVTGVGAGMSCHNHGYAMDSVLHVDGKPTWDMNDPHVREGYMLFGEMVQAVGLDWGGAWASLKDYPHVEMKSQCRVAIRAKRSGHKAPAMIADASQVSPAILLSAFAYQPMGEICPFDSPCEEQIYLAVQICPSPEAQTWVMYQPMYPLKFSWT